MNKTEQIDRLARKYFWQQKRKEITTFLTWAAIIIIGSGILLFVIYQIASATCGYFYSTCDDEKIIETAFMEVFLSGLFFAFSSMFYVMIREWINDNWKTAKNRALKELQ